MTVIWKLPPIESAVIEATSYLAGNGARYLHLSNTLPSPIGGISGAALREVNLGIVERRANYLVQAGHMEQLAERRSLANYPDGWVTKNRVEIIAGGGIYAPEHVRRYRDAGATRFSLATAFMWPPRAYRIMRSAA